MLLLAVGLALVAGVGRLAHVQPGPSVGRTAEAVAVATSAPSPPSVAPELPTELLAVPATSPGSPLAGAQIVSYYGNPYTAQMGILGSAEPEAVVARLKEQADRYDRLNGALDVVPALHLVYAVAQPHPTDNGLYLQYVSDSEVERFIELTEREGMLLFLDIQIGRSSAAAEVTKVLPYLRYPQVHLALDPEFAMAPGEVPGQRIGSLYAGDINRAQGAIALFVESERLPPKLLIIHQFTEGMLPDGKEIVQYPGVEVVVCMDGFGPAEIKHVKYERYAARSYASRAAIKLFFDHDPDLMTERDVIALRPQPAVVIYQ